MRPYGVVQRLLTLLQFSADLPSRGEDQIGVIEGVIADRMASLGDRACDVRPLFHVATDQKKRSVDAVLSQGLQQVKGVGIVGAVVKGKRQLL
jgi:hypothetical protein